MSPEPEPPVLAAIGLMYPDPPAVTMMFGETVPFIAKTLPSQVQYPALASAMSIRCVLSSVQSGG